MMFDKFYTYEIANINGVIVGSGMVSVKFYETPRKAYDDVTKDLAIKLPRTCQINFRR